MLRVTSASSTPTALRFAPARAPSNTTIAAAAGAYVIDNQGSALTASPRTAYSGTVTLVRCGVDRHANPTMMQNAAGISGYTAMLVRTTGAPRKIAAHATVAASPEPVCANAHLQTDVPV